MKRVFVEAFEDESRPQGGHAVIVIQGIEGLVDRPQFRLKPLDGGFVSRKGSGPRSNLLSPVTTRLTESGVELVVGPDIVENPLFLAGTPVVIEVPDAGVRGEFLWPNVAPLAQPRRRTVVARKSRSLPGASAAAGSGPLHKAEDLGLRVLEGGEAPVDDTASLAPVVFSGVYPGPIAAGPIPPIGSATSGDSSHSGASRGEALATERPSRGSGSDPIQWQGRQAANRAWRKRWFVPVLATSALMGALAFYAAPGLQVGTGWSSANARDKNTPPPRAEAKNPLRPPPASAPLATRPSRPAGPTTKVAAIAPGNTGPAAAGCGKPEVITDPLDGGRMRIRISADCRADEEVRLSYGGGVFVDRLDANGALDLIFDCFAGAATPVEIRFADGRVKSVPVVAADFARISKVAILWRAPVNLDLHAFEYAAERGERGHVYEHTPGTPSTALRETVTARRGRGFMSSSDTGRSLGDKLEVYTFFHSDDQASGAVDLALDFETRGDNPVAGTCGSDEYAEVPFRIGILTRGKQTVNEQGRLAAAECGARIGPDVRYSRNVLPVLKVRK